MRLHWRRPLRADAIYKMERNAEEKLKAVKRFKCIRNLVIITLIVAAVFRFVIGVSKVSGYSMYPTLENGDFVIYSRLEHTIGYGDIVAIKLASGEKYVKRIVALGGDTVSIKNGVFYVNGVQQDDMSTLEEDGGLIYPLTVPEGDVFTLGDNRPESIDSRFYGTVNARQIQGVLRYRIHGFSVSKVG